jgi:hypothetical protein
LKKVPTYTVPDPKRLRPLLVHTIG